MHLQPVGNADNAKVDVYAFSMILFELLEGKARELVSFDLAVFLLM